MYTSSVLILAYTLVENTTGRSGKFDDTFFKVVSAGIWSLWAATGLWAGRRHKFIRLNEIVSGWFFFSGPHCLEIREFPLCRNYRVTPPSFIHLILGFVKSCATTAAVAHADGYMTDRESWRVWMLGASMAAISEKRLNEKWLNGELIVP